MCLGSVSHFDAVAITLVRETYESADLFDGEAEVPAAAYELQQVNRLRSVEPLPCGASHGAWNQADLLVIANGGDAAAGL